MDNYAAGTHVQRYGPPGICIFEIILPSNICLKGFMKGQVKICFGQLKIQVRYLIN